MAPNPEPLSRYSIWMRYMASCAILSPWSPIPSDDHRSELRLVTKPIGVTGEMAEDWKFEVHARDEQLVGRDLIK